MEKVKRGMALALLAGFILSLLPATGARAEDYWRYVVLKGGYYGPRDEFGEDDFDGKDYWELGLGLDIGIIGLEIGAGYMKTENDFLEVRTIPILGTGKLRFPILFLYPSLEAGAGTYFSDIDPVVGDSGSQTDVGYHAGLGVDFRMDRLLVGVEARYLWIESEYENEDLNLDGLIVTGNVGFRF
jgi:opacity protein-like surface antigen